MILEICVDSFQSAKNAELGGADRIELCAALSEDGLTPSLGFAKLCVKLLSLEVYPMVRPRQGDFVYSKEELQIMIEDIRRFKAIGVHGIVVGVLQKNGRIHEVAMRRMINAARPLPVTFHRAFDHTPDPIKALDTLIDLKIDRVLTSGQQPTAMEGIDVLAQLVKHASQRIIIMPGSGVRSSNISDLLKSHATEYHGSARLKGSIEANVEEVKSIKTLLSKLKNT